MMTTQSTTIKTDPHPNAALTQPEWLEADFTAEETEVLTAGLMALLETQMRKKTQGDSGSLRVEDATELLASIRFTLTVYMQQQGLCNRALLRMNLKELFAQARQSLLIAQDETQKLYALAQSTVNPLGSVSMRDTLTQIGAFFRRYDARLYAHQIPADIDYQLSQPVPETMVGLVYIREYLMRLLIENELITCMDETRLLRLLRRSSPDYAALLVNLYEPVAAVVIGLSLLGGGETLLELTPAQGAVIRDKLMCVTRDQAQSMLTRVASVACVRLHISAAGEAYLRRNALSLYPRLAASPQSIRGVFSL